MLFTECGPGRYKGKVNTTNRYCFNSPGQRDECLLCPGNTIKFVSGDDPALCLNVCDGITSVANAERTTCGKLFNRIINVFHLSSFFLNSFKWK